MSILEERTPKRSVLPPEVAEHLGPFYVYMLSDPRDGRPFYVGKGSGQRLLVHGLEVDLRPERGQSAKRDRIRKIRSTGKEPVLEIVRYGLTEKEALLVEAALIDCLSDLTNLVGGHGSRDVRIPLAELVTTYGAEPLVATTPPVLLIRLQRWRTKRERIEPGYCRAGYGWRPGMNDVEVFDAARGWWARITPSSVEKRGVHHGVAVFAGVTRAVFEIDRWIQRRSDRRRAFTGRVLRTGKLHDAYVGRWGKRVPFTPHSQNPTSYWPRPR